MPSDHPSRAPTTALAPTPLQQPPPPSAPPDGPAHDRRHALTAGLAALPISVLGGLMGLGGAEFRLPVLVGPLRYAARQAVPLNLAISLVTLATALLSRGGSLAFGALAPFAVGILAMIAGGVTAAFFGAALGSRLANDQLERVILVLLVAIGLALLVEGFLPQQVPGLLPRSALAHLVAGVLFGLAIGLVSSLLGVAGGELIIPTMLFAFGADIKTAGTASLLIGLPTVAVGIVRYARRGALNDRQALRATVLPMGVGSVIGALLGGALVGLVPAAALKLGLGLVLIWSAQRIFRHTHAATATALT
ncbi:MAG TPA: sulfite exporter TauE/SafE family protein [Roseiflexaceae bacterium]|nr:sulfite exporter TauE/SafE family protein [Roseiflexaceae bacterium]